MQFQEQGKRMPSPSILSAAKRADLLALPDAKDEWVHQSTFSTGESSRRTASGMRQR